MNDKGKLYLVSAPSGAGKTTLIQIVLERFKGLSYSISHTTRPPRKNEQEGLDYYFVTRKEFEEKINQDSLLEWAKVHENYYGTSKDFVTRNLDKGKSLLLDIDVQGARQIMKKALNIVTIFIMPPSIEVLSQRLENRGTDSKKVIETRLKNAKVEIAQKDLYQYVVINDDLEQAQEELCNIFKGEMS
ncbi:MAG: guanylate kinase [Desulfobacula sp.]|nr:guanylate kinase [Desulfobacula sp.]